MYMLTNLWQNILCKAQYLKLQYFWFFETNKLKTYQKDSKWFALHCIRGQFGQRLPPAGVALQTCNELQRAASCETGSGHAKCVFSPTQKCIEDCRSRRKRRLWRQSSETLTYSSRLKSALVSLLQWFSHNTKLCFTPASVSTLRRTESCSIL